MTVVSAHPGVARELVRRRADFVEHARGSLERHLLAGGK
jgi:hypothetical protein